MGNVARIQCVVSIGVVARCGRNGAVIPKWRKIIPLQRIAFQDRLEIARKASRTFAKISIALMMGRHMRSLGRKPKEMVVTAAFSQIEDVYQRGGGDCCHDISTNREMSR